MIDLCEKKCEALVKHRAHVGLISGLGFEFSFVALYCTNAFCYYIGAVLIHHNKSYICRNFEGKHVRLRKRIRGLVHFKLSLQFNLL